MFLPNVCKCAQKLHEKNQNIYRENEKERTKLAYLNGAWLKAYICSRNVIYGIE